MPLTQGAFCGGSIKAMSWFVCVAYRLSRGMPQDAAFTNAATRLRGYETRTAVLRDSPRHRRARWTEHRFRRCATGSARSPGRRTSRGDLHPTCGGHRPTAHASWSPGVARLRGLRGRTSRRVYTSFAPPGRIACICQLKAPAAGVEPAGDCMSRHHEVACSLPLPSMPGYRRPSLAGKGLG